MDKVQKYNSFNSQRVFIVLVYFVIDSVRKLLDTSSYAKLIIRNFKLREYWEEPVETV
jgi:hypothetical protein